jgi:hypothetical protein
MNLSNDGKPMDFKSLLYVKLGPPSERAESNRRIDTLELVGNTFGSKTLDTGGVPNFNETTVIAIYQL